MCITVYVYCIIVAYCIIVYVYYSIRISYGTYVVRQAPVGRRAGAPGILTVN